MPEVAAAVSLNLVPYGNTKKSGNTFTCQHGPDECLSDLYYLCTMDHLGGVGTDEASKAIFPFVLCLESHEGNPSFAASCFESTLAKNASFTWADDILTGCAKDPARALAVQSAGAAATPKHDYVPWVLLQGKVLDNPDPLQELICEELAKQETLETPLPPACANFAAKAAHVRSRHGPGALPHWAAATRLQTCAA